MYQEPTDTSKRPIRTRYLGHLTGYQPIRDQYFLILLTPPVDTSLPLLRDPVLNGTADIPEDRDLTGLADEPLATV